MRYPDILFIFAKCRLHQLILQRTSNLLQTWRSSSIFISLKKNLSFKIHIYLHLLQRKKGPKVLWWYNFVPNSMRPWYRFCATLGVPVGTMLIVACKVSVANSRWSGGGKFTLRMLVGFGRVLEGPKNDDQRWFVGFVFAFSEGKWRTLAFFKTKFLGVGLLVDVECFLSKNNSTQPSHYDSVERSEADFFVFKLVILNSEQRIVVKKSLLNQKKSEVKKNLRWIISR